MTRIRNVQGKITETTGGNDISYAQESIVLNSHKAISVKGEEKGVSFQKPKSYKPKTDLLVTKVEGPYDEKDKLVKVVKKGFFYTYKASLSREPKPEEIKMLRWASKNDDGKTNELSGVSTHNALVKDKIIIGIAVNQDCDKVRIYAYYKKEDEKASVVTDVENIEILLIVGTEQHSQTYGNKLMFPAQAVREVRESYKHNKKVTIVIFTDGFNALELSTIEKDSKKINSLVNFKKINSITQLISYINNGEGSNTRDKVKVGIVKIFSHGLPSILDFGLDGSNSKSQRFEISHIAKLKVDSFTKKAEIYSYACRTGNADDRLVAYSDNYEYEQDWVKIVKPEESLAQKLSDHLDARVHAFLRRSNYTSTWVEGGDESYKKKYITIEDEEVSNPINPKDWFRKGWDDALWNPEGGYSKPASGKTPGGLLPSGMYVFEKGKKPSK
ncbi:MAG: hypothetical protein ABI549_02490 [Flavobacterium sp.]|uniref:hypothetical protein n=1 Tax=Flavobacterium sp. TaxID=239 RepID=UPI003265A921